MATAPAPARTGGCRHVPVRGLGSGGDQWCWSVDNRDRGDLVLFFPDIGYDAEPFTEWVETAEQLNQPGRLLDASSR